jgi:radical SAM-linked protein
VIGPTNETIQLVVRFRIGGSLRFLSHAETLRVFQRACVRAGFPIRYTEGFNPHARLSLPLPRPVGVESEDELLSVRVLGEPDTSRIKAELAAQLPEGCDLLSASITKPGASFQPRSATYVLPVRPERLDETLGATVGQLMARESLVFQRKMDDNGLRVKTVDVRGFLRSIEFDDRSIIVECAIGPAGSIRVDEILELLGLNESKLSGPVRRMKVQWQSH